MADVPLTIDPTSVFDNIDERQVEFAADVDGERRAFAAQYDLLRALAAEDPGDRAVALFQAQSDAIAKAAATALGRDPDRTLVVISENDL